MNRPVCFADACVSRALLALLACTLALSACGPAPGPASPGASPPPTASEPEDAGITTITFAAPEFERAAYEPLIEAFEAENPDMRVRLISLDEVGAPDDGAFDPAEMLRKTLSAADAAAPPFVRPEDADARLLLDLTPLMDADPSFARDDFYPGALDALAKDGASFLLPRTLSVPLIAYNKDLWATAGIPEPSAGWTWEDFLAAAERLAQRRGDTVDSYGFASFDAATTALLGLLAAAGDPLLGDAAAAARLDRPELAAALTRIAALVESGALYAPGDQGQAFGEVQRLLQDGRAAMWPDGLLAPAPNAAPPSFQIGVAPFPSPQIAPSFGTPASGYVISAGTQHPQEAWRWLSFVSRQQIARPAGVVLIGAGRTVPARRSVAAQSGFWDGLDAEARAVLEAALAQPAPRPPTGFAAARQALEEALQAVIGGQEPAGALADAQVALEERRAEVQASPTPAPPLVVATPEPQNIPAGATVIRFLAPFLAPAELRQVARAFSEANPDVYVEIVGNPGLFDEQTLADQADCFLFPGAPEASSALTGTLDLRPLADADPSFDLSDFSPALLAPFEREGTLRGLPYAASLRALNYNQDAFRDAGLTPPQADWTLDDFLNAAQQLSAGDDERTRTYGFASQGAMTSDLRFFLDRAGVSLISGSGDTAQPNLNDPRLAAALLSYIDLITNTTPHTGLSGYRSDEPLMIGAAFELVRNGRVGMWFDSGLSGVVIEIAGPERPIFATAIAPPPLAGSAATANDMEPIGMYISAKTSAPEACWAWLSHLSRDTALLGDAYPARRSVASSEAFLSSAQPGAAAVYEAYRAALDQPIHIPARGAVPLDPFWFFQAVDRALQGQSLESELAQAQRLSEQFMDCVRYGGGRGECARTVDPDYAGFAES